MVKAPRDVATALTELGIIIEKETNGELWALCPGHLKRLKRQDRSASWSVNRETGYHKCFSCGYGGTFLALVMDLSDMDMWAALRWIRRHGVKLVESADIPSYRENVEVEPKRGPKEPMSEAKLALFFRPPEAQLEKRFIDAESADLYDILWDITRQGWILPVRLPSGQLIGWQFKNERWFKNEPFGMAKSECVFGLELLAPGDTAVLVESPLDCPRIHTAIGDLMPDHIAVSSFGSEVTDVQLKRILERTDRIVYALDNDKAGRLATQVLTMGEEKRGTIKRRGWGARFRECSVYNYGEFKEKDPGEQTDEDIYWSLLNAIPVAALRLGRVKNRSTDDDPRPIADGRATRRGVGVQRTARDGAAARRGNPLRPVRGRQAGRNTGEAGRPQH